jgi:hypothetical protein
MQKDGATRVSIGAFFTTVSLGLKNEECGNNFIHLYNSGVYMCEGNKHKKCGGLANDGCHAKNRNDGCYAKNKK